MIKNEDFFFTSIEGFYAILNSNFRGKCIFMGILHDFIGIFIQFGKDISETNLY